MKKISLTLVPLIAAVLMGCDDAPEQVNRTCLDPSQTVVDTKNCEDMYQNSGRVSNHNAWFYYWYYTNNGYRPLVGSRAIITPGRGSFNAPEGFSFSPGARVGSVRGGFGGSAHGVAGE